MWFINVLLIHYGFIKLSPFNNNIKITAFQVIYRSFSVPKFLTVTLSREKEGEKKDILLIYQI